MTVIKSGFKNLQDKQEQQSAQRLQGDFIPYLRLGDDGDIARFRVISEHETERCAETGTLSYLISAMFHRHEARSTGGKKYFTTTLCALEEDEDGMVSGQCQLCDEEVSRTLQFLVWTYAYSMFHRQQGGDVKSPWKRVKVGEMTMYEEVLNKFMVWQDGFFSYQSLEGRIARYGNMTDRDYERTRRGARGSQQVKYELDALDPSPIDPQILEDAKKLPSLEDVASGAVRTMGGGTGEEGVKKASSEEAAAPAKGYREVPLGTTSDEEDDLPF